MSSESIDELFATTFNIIRDTATDAINKICDFIGELISSSILVICILLTH